MRNFLLTITVFFLAVLPLQAKHYKIYILTGQSNSLGCTTNRNSDAEAAIPPVYKNDEKIPFFWSNRSTRGGDGPSALIGSSDGKIVSLKEQQGEGGNKTFWGPEIGFARAMYKAGRKNTLVIKASRGGGGNGFWVKDGQMYNHVVKTVKDCLKALKKRRDTFEIVGLMYMQGESNNGGEAKVAGPRFHDLLTELRKELPKARKMKGYISGVASGNHNATRASHKALAEKEEDIFYFSNMDLRGHLFDGLHFGTEAKLLIGKRLSEMVRYGKLRPRIRVACIGDSITYGAVIQGRVANCYPTQLQKLLGDRYEVRNFGHNGRCIIKTSKAGRGLRGYIHTQAHKDALAYKPQIVICNLGINDIMDYPTKSEQFIPDYKELLTLYRELESKPKIIIWTKLGPLMKGQRFYKSKYLAKMNQDLEKTRQELNERKIRKRYKTISNLEMEEPLNDRQFMSNDHIHPNAAGAKVIAEETYQKMLKLKLVKTKTKRKSKSKR